MRRISRPTEPPRLLTSQRALDEKRKLLDYLRRDKNERRHRRDGLNDDIFFDAELRRDLSHVFEEKCAFCESKIGADGQVLHLRPLRFAESKTNSDRDYYLWLAFEWRNIFYACSYCLKAKGSKFPVVGDRAMYLAAFDDVVQHEDALLVDPTAEDPARHFRLRCDGSLMANTNRGRETIEAFDLNRIELIDGRRYIIESLFSNLQSDTNRHTEESLAGILESRAPHAGAIQGMLKRIDSVWRAGEIPLKGGGDILARRFLDVWRQTDQKQRSKFADVLQQLQEVDQRIQHEERESSAQIPLAYVSIREKAELVAGDREISRIEISNFKAIEKMKFELQSSRSSNAGTPALMILGENSTGKSSVLAAIGLALIGRRQASKLKKYFPSLVRSKAIDRLDQLDEQRIAVDVGFHYSGHTASFIYDPVHRILDGPEEQSSVVLGYGPRRFFTQKKRQHAKGAAARIRTLFDPLATIPYPADWLRAQTGERFDTVARALRVVLALDDSDELVVEPDHLAVRANGRTTPIDSLSEGYRSMFVMTVDIIRELLEHWKNLEQAQAVVLIDELETHLHPRWKMQVMTSLRRVLPRVQFIATTHDPLCLRGMDDGEVVVLQRDNESNIRQLHDLPGVSGMSAEQLLTSDYFGLASTADPSTEIELARLAGDVARRGRDGTFELAPALATTELITRLTIGDSPTEQIIQSALLRYLKEREARDGDLRPTLRTEAVEAVIKALRSSEE
jgi:hypothetical protein